MIYDDERERELREEEDRLLEEHDEALDARDRALERADAVTDRDVVYAAQARADRAWGVALPWPAMHPIPQMGEISRQFAEIGADHRGRELRIPGMDVRVWVLVRAVLLGVIAGLVLFVLGASLPV